MKLITQRIILFICGLPFMILLFLVGKETMSGFVGGQTNEPQLLMVLLTIIIGSALVACWAMIFYKKILPKIFVLPYGLMVVVATLMLVLG